MGKADIPVAYSFEVHVVDAILNELFAGVSEILVFHPLMEGLIELSFDGCYLGSCPTPTPPPPPGKMRSAMGGVLMGVAVAYSAAVRMVPK